MKNSRLVQLLEGFNSKELNELKEFIQCKFLHNNRKRYDMVIRLFQELIPNRNKVVYIEKITLYETLFGRGKVNMIKLDHHISQATDLVQKYLVHKYQTENSIRFESTLLNSLEDRGLSKPFKQLKAKMQRELSKKISRDSSYFYTSYNIADISLEFKLKRNNEMRDGNSADLEVAISNLDLFFLITELNYACQSFNVSNIVKASQSELPLLECIINDLPKTSYFQMNLIQMWWNAYKLVSTSNFEYYQNLKNLLFEHYKILSPYYLKNLFIYAKNYCIRKISGGDSNYYAEFWDISTFRLNKGLMKKLSPASYKNFITAGVMLGLQQNDEEFKEALKFTKQHTDKLPSEYREEAITYAQAYLAFYQNSFRTVPQKLITHQKPLTIYKFGDIFYQVDARRLLIMTYFSLKNEEDNFDKVWNNLNTFLDKNKEQILEEELEKNRKFLPVIKRLFWLNDYNQDKRETQLRELQKEIEKIENISDRTWLLKQIELKSN